MKRLVWLLFAILSLTSCDTSSRPTLHIFTWGEFFDPEVIADFEKQFQCRVVIDTFDSNESMYAKLKLGSSRYDLVLPSSYYLEILKKQGMIAPYRADLIPNLSKIDPIFFNAKWQEVGIPFLINYTGIAYREDRLGNIERSWKIFSQADLRGRMTMLNDPRETIGAALQTLGYSINTTDIHEIDQAVALLLKWKENLAKFENEQYKNGIASSEFLVVHGYSSDLMQVREENENVVFFLPMEGGVLSIDCLAIPSKAPEPELAHTFINFLLEPENAARIMTYTFSLIPVEGGAELLDPGMASDRNLFPANETIEKMEQIEDLGEQIRLYNQAWDRVKAG